MCRATEPIEYVQVVSDDKRFEFVFCGRVTPEEWEAADSTRQTTLLRNRFASLDEAQQLVRIAVAIQILGGNPPAAWEAVQRLTDAGLDADRAMGQIAMAFVTTLTHSDDSHHGDDSHDQSDATANFDDEAYAARLARLPLPSAEDTEDVLVDIAAAEGVLATDDLVAHAITRLGWPVGDPLMVDLVERVEEELADEFGPHAWLAGDRTASVAALTNGIVLTHVLNDAEPQIAVLNVSFDLAGFGRLEEVVVDGHHVEAISAEPGHVAWAGPDGWLDRFTPGDVLAVRVAQDGTATIGVLPATPRIDDGLVAALRRVYDTEVAEPGLPVSAEDLILGLLAADRDAFAQPQAPLAELCAAAGLEQRASQVAHDEEIWANERAMRRIGRLLDATGDDVEVSERVLAVMATLDAVALGTASRDAINDALGQLSDVEVLDLVTDEVLGFIPLHEPTVIAERLVAAASNDRRRATARLLAALAAESLNEWTAAEQHLELAAEADPSNPAVCDRLAWYVSDRGDAARAARLWRRCAQDYNVDDVIATVEEFMRHEASPLGRNDSCWCGSGRKYKHCHLGVAAPAALPDRVGWLCRKAVCFLERSGPEARDVVVDLAIERAGEHNEARSVMGDPIVMDAALTEGGWFARFLAARGHLLPDDELALAQRWVAIPRTLYEINEVRPGGGLVVTDLRTLERLDVRERTFSRQARVDTVVCARAVPDGQSHQLIGAVLPVAAGREGEVLDMLDDGDPYALAGWAGSLHRPPELRNRENEQLLKCELVVSTSEPGRLVAHLDATYDVDEPGVTWIEHVALSEQERILRATFRLGGDRLTITANSNERADRILAQLRDALDVQVVSDARTPFDITNLPDSLPLAGPSMAPEVVEQIQDHMERTWCDEPVPALSGLTPRQAADDPTRREQLVRLLASFDGRPAPSQGFGMRPARLRTLLGL